MDLAKTILIVEDNEALLGALVDKFVAEKFVILEARNGEEGLEVAIKKHPDLILSDIIMPRMDGMTMLKRLREDKWGKDVPVIILTNLSEPDKVAEAYDRGAYEFLVKSEWTLEDLVRRVKARLKIE